VYKTELIKNAAEKTNLSTGQIKDALQNILESISSALARGEKVTLVGFGTFSVQERAARKGTNPNTGKPIEIPKRKAVRFKPGGDLVRTIDPKRKPAKQKKTRGKKKAGKA